MGGGGREGVFRDVGDILEVRGGGEKGSFGVKEIWGWDRLRVRIF